jgi:hypothetical protein
MQDLLARYLETRIRSFLERAELHTDTAEIPEETFRERLLRLRCYLAEPDEPSEELLSRLRVVVQTVELLNQAIAGNTRPLELKRSLRPLRKAIAVHAPELHTLLYEMAEHMSLVGENSPEDAQSLHRAIIYRCHFWLARLHAYYYALLG